MNLSEIASEKNSRNEEDSSSWNGSTDTTGKSRRQSLELDLLEKQSEAIRKLQAELEASRKAQDRIEGEVRELRARKSKLREQVDASSVEAVQAAQNALKEALRNADGEIAECRKEAAQKVREAEMARRDEVRKTKAVARKANESLKRIRGALLFTWLCCLAVNPAVSLDARDFVTVPFSWIWENVSAGNWWHALIIPAACPIGFLLVRQYAERWCGLSQTVILASASVIFALGGQIRRFLPCNLVLLFLIIQAAYLVLLHFLDGFFESRYMREDWEKMQGFE